MQKTKKLGILVCVCMLIVTMGALVGCSGTDEDTDTGTTYESSNDTDTYDAEDDTSDDIADDSTDEDLQEDTSTTEESYSLDSSILDESYLSSDEDSLLDSTEDSSDIE